MEIEAGAFEVKFLEAIALMKARGVVLPDIYYGELQGIARLLAFSISGVASVQQLEQVKDSLTAAMDSGQSFATWKNQLTVEQLNLPDYRLDNIYRTNIQGQYQAGKWEQFTRHTNRRPYLMYDAINDARVRPNHLALDNVIRPVNDLFWKQHAPPNGYRCRCTLIALTEAQAKARSAGDKGLNNQPIPEDIQPDKGWTYSPADRLGGINQTISNLPNNAITNQLKMQINQWQAQG